MSGFDERHIDGVGGVDLAVRMPVAGPERPGGGTAQSGVAGPERPGGEAAQSGVAGPDPARRPALLVHGLSSNARLWDGVAARLAAAGHPVAAVDLRGHGRSGKPDYGYDWPTLSGDLLAVIAALGWSSPVAAGQSFGGNLVLELAARHPDALSAAVLVDGGTIELTDRFADWPTCEAALAPPVLDGTSAERFESFLRLRHEDWSDEAIAATLANVEVRPDGTIRPWLGRQHHLALLRLLWEHHPSERWAALSIPVVLVPADDPQAPDGRFMAVKREEVVRAQQGLVRSTTRWIVGDHDLHAQHPDEVAALIAGSAP